MCSSDPSSPNLVLNSLLRAERCSVERSGATCVENREGYEYCEAGAMSDANDDGRHVGFLQTKRHFEDFLDGNVEFDAHRFE